MCAHLFQLSYDIIPNACCGLPVGSSNATGPKTNLLHVILTAKPSLPLALLSSIPIALHLVD